MLLPKTFCGCCDAAKGPHTRIQSCDVAVSGCSLIPAGWFSVAGHHCTSCMSGCGGVAIWGAGGRRGVGVQDLGSSGPGWGYKLF